MFQADFLTLVLGFDLPFLLDHQKFFHIRRSDRQQARVDLLLA